MIKVEPVESSQVNFIKIGFARKLVNRLSRINLLQKLIFSYFVILLVPSIFFGVYYYRNIQKNIEADLVKNIKQDVFKEVTGIRRNIDICGRSAQFFLGDRDMLRFMGRNTVLTVQELISFSNTLVRQVETMTHMNPDINNVIFFARNPNLNEVMPALSRESCIEQTAWFKHLINRENKILWRLSHKPENYFGINPGNSNEAADVVSMYIELISNDGGDKLHGGILEINMRSDVFFQGMYTPDTSNKSFFCIINTDEAGDGIFYNKNDGVLKMLDLDMPSLKRELLRRTASEEDGFRLDIGGRSVLVAYQYISDINSYVYKVLSDDELSKKLNAASIRIILVIILSILVLSIVTYLITSILLKKVKVIISSIRKVQDGDLNAEIPMLGNDEIGELSQHFRKMLEKINELLSLVVQKQLSVKDAEIGALQSQINAHFIYNVLETIKMMAEIESQFIISDTVTCLGSIMRYSMSWREHLVTLEDELENARNYMQIADLRFPGKFRFEVNICKELLNQELPRMSIQPVIENAIQHGMNTEEPGGIITIDVFMQEDGFCIDILDNGCGIPPERLELISKGIDPDNGDLEYTQKNKSIGLRNVNERIKMFYGNDYGLTISSVYGEYTKVHMLLPYKRYLEGNR